jgi:hypothetical protein
MRAREIPFSAGDNTVGEAGSAGFLALVLALIKTWPVTDR